MNILVIGNGFDLAHDLPTKYTDFLDWIIDQTYFYEYLKEEGAEIVKNISSLRVDIPKAKRRENLSQRVPHQKEIWECIDNNVWIDYFLRNSMYSKENWIDFESEISKIIQSIDTDMQEENFENRIDKLSNEYLMSRYYELTYDDLFVEVGKKKDTRLKISYRELRVILNNDLNRLIRALEIYLCEYVAKIEIQKRSPDIDKLKIDKVLSFNYTDTFSKLYKVTTDAENDDVESFDYIHGKADISNTIESNNMVLGIDEYLPDDRKNKDIEFIAFKKFYQRIYKQTGCKYKEWVDEIQRNYSMALRNETNYMDMMKTAYNKKDQEDMRNWFIANWFNNQTKNEKHNLYIFGHSLDVTDKDILKDLILNDNIHTTIFYHNKDAMGQQIANLVKVIGQDELIKRTGGSTKTIEFVPQKPMKPINGQEIN